MSQKKNRNGNGSGPVRYEATFMFLNNGTRERSLQRAKKIKQYKKTINMLCDSMIIVLLMLMVLVTIMFVDDFINYHVEAYRDYKAQGELVVDKWVLPGQTVELPVTEGDYYVAIAYPKELNMYFYTVSFNSAHSDSYFRTDEWGINMYYTQGELITILPKVPIRVYIWQDPK